MVMAAYAVVVLIGGAGLLVGHALKDAVAGPVLQAEKAHVDRWGDPLPPGAIARLGTVRFRTTSGGFFSGLGFLADSKTVVSVTGGHTVQFWEAATGKQVREISTGNISIRSFALSPDGRHFAADGFLADDGTGPMAGAVGIWDTASGKEVRTIKRLDKDVDRSSMAFTPDNKLLMSLGRSGVLRVEEIATGVELLQHQFPQDIGGNLALSADGSMLAVASGPNTRKLYLWKWQAAEEPRELKVPDRVGNALAFSRDGKVLAECGDLSEAVRLWDVASGRLLGKLEAPDPDNRWTKSVMFSPDGKSLIVSTRSNTTGAIHIWDAGTWKHLSRLELDRDGGGHLAVSPDSRLLAGMGGGGVRVWDLASGTELSTNDEAHQGNVHQIAATGDLVVTASDDHTIRLWDATTGKQRLKLAHGHWVRAMALSPDGTKIVSSSLDDTVCLWDVASGRKIYKLPGHGQVGGRRAVSFMPDGKHFLSWGDDMYLRKWEVATGKAVLEHAIRPQGMKMPGDDADDGDKRQMQSMMFQVMLGEGTFSLDGKTFLLSASNQFHMFDVATGKDLFQIPNEGSHVTSVAISPDSRLLLASAWGKSITTKLPDGRMRSSSAKNHPICLWELATLQMRKKVMLPDGGAGPVAFSPDNKLFAAATGEPDCRIRIWDMANGNEVGVIQGYRGRVSSLAFAPDSKRLISGMDDTTALVWDLALLAGRAQR